MRFTVVGLLLVLMVSAVPRSAGAEPEKSTEEAQQIVVHLSHFTDDLHAAFMALKVAGLLQEHGAKVTIFLDLEGVRLAERRQTLDVKWGSSDTPLAEYYDSYINGGGKLILCPHCAKSAHLGDGGLKRNAEIGTMPILGKLLIDADKVMDY